MKLPKKPDDRDRILNISGDEAYARRGRQRNTSGFGDDLSGEATATLNEAANVMGGGATGMDLAAKMMQKMGWQEGQSALQSALNPE